MHSRTGMRPIVLTLLVVAAAAAIGIGAYNAGVAHGIAESGRALVQVPAPGGAPAVPVVPYPYYWHRPWGFGFFPIFGFLFLFFVLRGLLWRGPWRGGWGYGGYCGGVPPGFDEWHRRAHQQEGTPQPPQGTPA